MSNPATTTLSERPFYFFARNGDLEAIRLGKWKLHISKSKGWNEQNNGKFQESLYNLDTDIGEKKNLISQYPEIAEKLKIQLQNFDPK